MRAETLATRKGGGGFFFENSLLFCSPVSFFVHVWKIKDSFKIRQKLSTKNSVFTFRNRLLHEKYTRSDSAESETILQHQKKGHTVILATERKLNKK